MMRWKTGMAFPIISFMLLSGSPGPEIASLIKATHIPTDDSLVYAGDDFLYGAILPTVQVAQWKSGYIIAYVNAQMRSKFFFTDGEFRKMGKEYELPDRIIYQVVTGNEEIAFLTASRVINDDNIISKHAYFTKVDESGKVVLERHIIGSDNVDKPNETELDDWGNYLMCWTGNFYVTFFPIQHNFKKIPPPDVHQGDCTYFIKPDGTILSFSDWGASHSFEQRMVIGKKFIVQMAKGDAYPRGLDASFIDLKKFEVSMIDKDEKDQNNPDLKYVYDPKKLTSCTPFTASGAKGENYVPFSLGDIVCLSKNTSLMSFCSKDKKPTYDIGLVKVHVGLPKCSEPVQFITNTPNICEHSVRMAAIQPNEILIFWKEFETNTCKAKIARIEEELDIWDADQEIFSQHNLDQNMMAIIDSTGRFLEKPCKVAEADWYYTISLMENHTGWHNIIDGYGNHSYSPFFNTHRGELAWAHHKHRSKEIDLYIFTKE